MKHLFLSLLMLLTTFMSQAQNSNLVGPDEYSILNGDLNHDGQISAVDITLMSEIILKRSNAERIVADTPLEYTEAFTGTVLLQNGEDFNVTIKQLVKPSASYDTDDSFIKKITFRNGSTTDGVEVSASTSECKARAVYDEAMREVTVYVEGDVLEFPMNSTYMFRGLTKVTTIDWNDTDIKCVDTGNVTNMNGMFYGCQSLTTLDVSNFDTGNVTDMTYMFYGCQSLTTLNLSNFKTDNVTDMYGMFAECQSLTTLDLSNFTTSNVTDMSFMFDDCESLTNLNLGYNFVIGSECKTQTMCYHLAWSKPACTITCTTATQAQLRADVTRLNEPKIIWNLLDAVPTGTASLMTGSDFNAAIKGLVTPSASLYTLDETIKAIVFHRGIATDGTLVSNANSECEARAIYDASTQVVSIYANAKVLEFPEDCNNMYFYLKSLSTLDWSEFGEDLSTSKMKSMNRMFAFCDALSNLDFSHFDTSNVTDMCQMFNSCWALDTLDLTAFDTHNVTDMSLMFNYCKGLTSLDVSSFDTGKVTNMASMFSQCFELKALDVSNFDTGNVTDMSSMFEQLRSMTNLDLANFNTSKVTNMGKMFSSCMALSSLNIKNFNTSNVRYMNDMFSTCWALTKLDLSHFNTTNVATMKNMFYNCSKLTSLNLSSFTTTNVSYMQNMFGQCFRMTSLNLGSRFVVVYGNVDKMCEYMSDVSEACVITCTSSTKNGLLSRNTSIKNDYIGWRIL